MIICHQYKFIFLKSRKTAGTSVEIALSRLCSDRDTLTPISPKDEITRRKLSNRTAQNTDFPGGTMRRHASVAEARALIEPEIWDSYFTFSLERNPYDKAISLYYWRTRNQVNPPEINQFILTTEQRDISNWHIYSDGDSIAVDRVFLYENLEEHLAELAIILDESSNSKNTVLAFKNLPRAKSGYRSNHQNHRNVLSEESRRHIEHHCGREIQEFGYRW